MLTRNHSIINTCMWSMLLVEKSSQKMVVKNAPPKWHETKNWLSSLGWKDFVQNRRIRVSPQKVERALSFDYPLFLNWFPIIFADEITALPARKLDLAIGVSVGSSTQIALFVVPVSRRYFF